MRRRRRRRRIAAATTGLLLFSVAATLWTRAASGRTPLQIVSRPSSSERAPENVRIRVQVLNGTQTRGLARRATTALRDRGFDVVDVGTITSSRDTTLVIDVSGHPDWAKRVARALAPARIETRRDTSRYLDITVVLGTAWRPPTEPLHP
jgi:hypothetical protein